MLWGNALPTLALDILGPGFTPLGQLTASSTSRANGNYSYNTNGTLGINIYVGRSNDFTTRCSSVLPNIQTPDGNYYGWELSPNSGVYGVIYDSALNSWVWNPDNYTTRASLTATWQANGKASTNGTDNIANCYTAVPHTDRAAFSLRVGDDTLSGQLKYGVYVDTTRPQAGTYNLQFYLGKYQGTFIPVSQILNVHLTACTVTTPSQVRFGTVDAGSVAPVISPDSGIDLACSGRAPTVNVSYSAQAVSPTQTSSQLVMSNGQNQAQGTVRGFIGNGADADAGCNDAATSIHFGNPAKSLLANAASNQSHTIPLKWVLCPNATPVLGEGRASATLDIIWQ
ncbi:hypothetical protein Z042_20525 [Chania multitudinisentens RB-25]|uniref:Fimbrial-type adhesion domain-containing protein n=2 Tax=Chania TaxID=1745211 RepID=W0LKK7_9GAMM|nr:hypothetical protein Z042_20525 [Chania multitudinisentens RB-25]